MVPFTALIGVSLSVFLLSSPRVKTVVARWLNDLKTPSVKSNLIDRVIVKSKGSFKEVPYILNKEDVHLPSGTLITQRRVSEGDGFFQSYAIGLLDVLFKNEEYFGFFANFIRRVTSLKPEEKESCISFIVTCENLEEMLKEKEKVDLVVQVLKNITVAAIRDSAEVPQEDHGFLELLCEELHIGCTLFEKTDAGDVNPRFYKEGEFSGGGMLFSEGSYAQISFPEIAIKKLEHDEVSNERCELNDWTQALQINGSKEDLFFLGYVTALLDFIYSKKPICLDYLINNIKENCGEDHPSIKIIQKAFDAKNIEEIKEIITRADVMYCMVDAMRKLTPSSAKPIEFDAKSYSQIEAFFAKTGMSINIENTEKNLPGVFMVEEPFGELVKQESFVTYYSKGNAFLS